MKSLVERRISAALASAFLTLSVSGFCTNLVPAHAAGIAPKNSNEKSTLESRFNGNGSGLLAIITPDGKREGVCPLKHTDVKADISGYVARVSVKQVFENTTNKKIEAIYTFPLSDSAAVDEMDMKVGSRTIHGTIKKREEARAIYEQAKSTGHVASLLDQERTNIFTQSVANIEPGAKVEITIKYVDLLPYESGNYTFAFPTVVGPRFIPGSPTGRASTGLSPDTDAVPDASKITPVVAEERSGADINIDVKINEGTLPINGISSKLHEIQLKHREPSNVELVLKNRNTIPNKDFVLTWGVAGDKLQSGYLTHKDGEKGYFTVMMMPPKRVSPAEVAPKEMIFLIDCSGSQSGPPLQKAKEAMLYILDHMNDNDTFQIVAFNNNVQMSSSKPEKASASMRKKAREYINNLQANGGTWMAPAVEKVCSIPADEHRLRIVTFMTDGYVGNDYEVMGMVKKLRGKSRWFPFGTGNSVNRTLIDGIASEGGGEPEYVLLNSSAEVVGKKFYDRISSPVLTDISLDWHGLPVKEVFPHDISDVWAERPLYIAGTYTKAAEGTLTVSGFAGGKPYKQDIKLVFPEKQTANEVLGPIWARKKVDRLMAEDWFGIQAGRPNKELQEEIIETALKHHIMTQFTSFVAVEEKAVTKGGQSTTVAVPVDMPEGVSKEMTLPGAQAQSAAANFSRQRIASPKPMAGYAVAAGGGAGISNGFVSGSLAKRSAMQFNAPAQSRAVPSLPTAAPSAPSVLEDSGDSLTNLVSARVDKTLHQEAGKKQRDVLKCKDERKADADESDDSAEKQAAAKNCAKLDAKLNQLVRDVAKNAKGNEAMLRTNNKIKVKIQLSTNNAKVIAALKAKGARIAEQENKTVIVEISVSRLMQLAAMAEVEHIEAIN